MTHLACSKTAAKLRCNFQSSLSEASFFKFELLSSSKTFKTCCLVMMMRTLADGHLAHWVDRGSSEENRWKEVSSFLPLMRLGEQTSYRGPAKHWLQACKITAFWSLCSRWKGIMIALLLQLIKNFAVGGAASSVKSYLWEETMCWSTSSSSTQRRWRTKSPRQAFMLDFDGRALFYTPCGILLAAAQSLKCCAAISTGISFSCPILPFTKEEHADVDHDYILPFSQWYQVLSADMWGHLLAELQEVPGGGAEDDGGRSGQDAAGHGNSTDRNTANALGWGQPTCWQGETLNTLIEKRI